MTDRLELRLRRMRDAFDASFTEPARPPADERLRLLSVRTAAGPAVLSLDQVAAVESRPDLTPLPGAPGSLLGLGTLRGVLVAAHSLTHLLGGEASPLDPCRWLALTKQDPTVALAFDEVESYLRVPTQALVAVEPRVAVPHVRQFVRVGDASYPLIEVDAVVRSLRSGSAIIQEET